MRNDQTKTIDMTIWLVFYKKGMFWRKYIIHLIEVAPGYSSELFTPKFGDVPRRPPGPSRVVKD